MTLYCFTSQLTKSYRLTYFSSWAKLSLSASQSYYVFRPSPITNGAIKRITSLAGATSDTPSPPSEELFANPSPTYPLDPNRGVHPNQNDFDPAPQQADIVIADSVVDNMQATVRDATEKDQPPDRIHTLKLTRQSQLVMLLIQDNTISTVQRTSK